MSETLRFSISKGSLALKGSRINALADKWIDLSRANGGCGERFDQASAQRFKRDGDNYHMTIISACEMKTLSSTDSDSLVQSLNSSLLTNQSFLPLHDIGVGCYQEQCYYVILFSPFLQKTRLQLNLPPIDLHITLAFHGNDVHEVRKGFSTLWLPTIGDGSNETPVDYDLMYTIKKILQSKSTQKVRDYLNYHRLAEVASHNGYLFGAYYVAKYGHQGEGLTSCDILEEAINNDKHCNCKQLKLKSSSGTSTRFGTDIDIDYGDLVCQALNFHLYSPLPYHYRLRRFYTSVLDINRYEIRYIEMPRNFSFITDKVAGSSLPDTRHALESLVAVGITDIVTVMEKPLHNSHISNIPLRFHWFEVADRTPPTPTQMKDIMNICDQPHSKTLVHCLGGVGRTATVLGSYLMWSQGLSRLEAKQPLIDNRRTILTTSQEDFLTTWYATCLEHSTCTATMTLASTAATTTVTAPATSVLPTATKLSSSAQSITQTQQTQTQSGSAIKFPPLIMCVGYPASGKSTFAEALCASNPDR